MVQQPLWLLLTMLVAWVPWVMPLVDLRQAILPQPQWMRQMQLLVQLWMALWIKVEHRRLQTLVRLRLMTQQVQQWPMMTKASQTRPLAWAK
tara:strand:- start:195 stop:470 length:276 start_codon:yes stop_codon:yes gene_type:complete